MRVEFVIPIHKKWGTTFKLYVDVNDLNSIEDVKDVLRSNGLEDIGQSGSGEKQRIYFLIPKS